jgi:DNA invertase Pin-like site-specific DNA recombinase
MRVAFYVRVSTIKQSVELQLRDLESVARRSAWDVVTVFHDQGVSGATKREGRSGLDELMKAAIRKEFDMIAIWSIDRLARSTLELFNTMSDLYEKKIDLYVHKQAVDTSTPSGRMMWQLLGVFAEFERAVIQERVKAGIQNARLNGVRLGRPKISSETVARIMELRSQGMGMLKIARTLKVGTSQVQRACQSK